jgi:hypothetical protein
VRADRAGAYFLVDAASEDDAREQFATLRFVCEGIMAVEFAEVMASA